MTCSVAKRRAAATPARNPVTDVASAVEAIAGCIHLFRGHRVMLDAGLAELYRVETKVLVQAVKRNLTRFPGDFMFQLASAE
jgi:hypothetical protein